MNYKELLKEIKSDTIHPVYLFTGQEQLLIEEILKKLKDKIIDPAYGDFNLIAVNGEEDSIEKVFEAIETLPFMQEKKMVFVKDAPYFKAQQDRLTEEQRQKLEDYLAKPSLDTCVVFVAPQTDKRKRVSKAVSSKGCWVEFAKLERPVYEKWLEQQLKAQGKEIDGSMLKYLIDMSGYQDKNSDHTLLDIVQQMERLLSYVGERKSVTREDINTIFEKPLEYNIFMMTDGIAEGNGSMALKMLNELIGDGEAEIKILFMIARHYRILLRTKLNQDAGYTGKDMAGRVGVAPFLVKKYMNQTARLGMKGIKKGLEAILQTDQGIKTGKITAGVGLEMLVVKLSQGI